jgi:hypothetical protein
MSIFKSAAKVEYFFLTEENDEANFVIKTLKNTKYSTRHPTKDIIKL